MQRCPSPVAIFGTRRSSTGVQSLSFGFPSRTLRIIGNMNLDVRSMDHQGTVVTEQCIYHLVRDCSKKQDFVAGKLLYVLLAYDTLDGVAKFGDNFIRLFAACNSIQDADKVFKNIIRPTVYTWNFIISANIDNRRCEEALVLYFQMQEKGFVPNAFILSNALKACSILGSLYHGNLVNDLILKIGADTDLTIRNGLLDMFFQCGNIEAAEKIFKIKQERDVVTWTTMILGYYHQGFHITGFQFLEDMQMDGIGPNRVTFLCILKACSSTRNLSWIKHLHHHIIKYGLESEITLRNMLMDVYGKCNSIKEAEYLFETFPNRDVVSWSVLMSTYSLHGCDDLALQCLDKLEMNGVEPNECVFVCALNVSGKNKWLKKGKQANDIIVRMGFEKGKDIGNALIKMYMNCGLLDEARVIFDRMFPKDGVSWGSIISGCIQHEEWDAAVDLFKSMQSQGYEPDVCILSCSLKACGAMQQFHRGKLIHFQIITEMLEHDNVIGNAIVDMYAKCGSLDDANKVFGQLQDRNVISWGTMIAGYCQHGNEHLALDIFEKMRDEGHQPNEVIFSCVLKACIGMRAAKQGKIFHEEVIRGGLESCLIVANTLIDMYVSCENIAEAQRVFDLLPNRDAVSWGTLIHGYAEQGHGSLALQCFKKLLKEGLDPNKVTFLGVLKACGSVGDISKGRLVHDLIIRSGIDPDVMINSTLVNMYSKCGGLQDLNGLLHVIQSRDEVTMGILSAAYAHHGKWEQGKRCLEAIEGENIIFEAVYTSILSAFSHLGQSDRVQGLLDSNSSILPVIEHYNCVADYFGRIGYLTEAKLMHQVMPMCPDFIGWVSLMTSCKTYGNVELGRDCLDRLTQLNPNIPVGYMLMSNLYADKHLSLESSVVQDLRKCFRAWKKPGKAWIEVDDMAHEFLVSNVADQETDVIMKKLYFRLKLEGFIPNLESSLDLENMKGSLFESNPQCDPAVDSTISSDCDDFLQTKIYKDHRT